MPMFKNTGPSRLGLLGAGIEESNYSKLKDNSTRPSDLTRTDPSPLSVSQDGVTISRETQSQDVTTKRDETRRDVFN
jgi:hypothetical protein